MACKWSKKIQKHAKSHIIIISSQVKPEVPIPDPLKILLHHPAQPVTQSGETPPCSHSHYTQSGETPPCSPSHSVRLDTTSVGDPNPNPNTKGSKLFEGSKSVHLLDSDPRMQI